MQGSLSAVTPRGTPSRRGRSPRFSSDSPLHTAASHLTNQYPNNSSSTFATSLDIRVEGALPIKDDSKQESNLKETQTTGTSDSERRAPRKSKTDALAALNDQARALSTGLDEDDVGNSLTAKYRHAAPISVSSSLDLASVKTSTPHSKHSKPPGSRPFGLQDCPEYYPTPEEFKDPMEYIRSIAAEAREYGICKIIPPSDWKMPFVTDTEAFRFKTRLQRLNSIEASARAKLNFLEQLYQFHQQQGNTRISVPTINHKPLDLWLLRKEVKKLGGYEAVTASRKWSDLGRLLGYRGIPGLSTQIKSSYARVILPYEQFCERTKVSPTMTPVAPRDTKVDSPIKPTRSSTGSNEESVPSSPLTATSSPLSEPPDESENKSTARPRRSIRVGSVDQANPKKPVSLSHPVVPPPIFYDNRENRGGTSEQSCEICHKTNRGDKMLLCDECDCGFHMDCLDPPIATIPAENWFCYNCLSQTGGDFGFDEGEEHSLSSFQARDLEFRRLWFESYPPHQDRSMDLPDYMHNQVGNVVYSEYDVEEEFWRLVQSPHETVEIEYGADIHSTTHGSAMPTLETHPLDPYSKHPWNLNNIPIAPESLLRYIKSDISGMTVPWTYVGMVFSTFCWHNEDHYTYSINYMHWGETKTWYGIPGDDAELFEAAIKGEAPDLFQAQPDLLFQLVTLMNPRRLTDAGVHVYACNQRAGEFVITFPKAYHAGFNHGLNFNEAVNFALPDWLPFGLACVERYREHRKLPVFSHDELIMTIAQHSSSIKTSLWLADSLREMTEREVSNRKKARARGLPEILSEEDRPEEQYQCTICKVFCYLSHITCRCDKKVACVDHLDLLCDKSGQPNHLTLRKRIEDNSLISIQDRVIYNAGIPDHWNTKFSRILKESARPQLRQLRAILAEGDRINYPLLAMHNLRKCVIRANDWVDYANSFLIRKQSRKRSRKSRRNDSDDPAERPDRGLGELYAHLKEVQDLGFDCPEIATLQNLAQEAEKVKAKAIALLKKCVGEGEQEQEAYLQECKRLLLDGSSLNVILNELTEIEKIVDRDTLVKELSDKLDESDAMLTLDEVHQLLARARACGLPTESKYLRVLEAREQEGNDWERRAKLVLDKPVKTIAELEQFAEMDSTVPINPDTHSKLLSALAKAKDFEKQANVWLHPDASSVKPRISEVMRLVTRAKQLFDIDAVTTLESTARVAESLENKCEELLRRISNRSNDPLSETIETIEDWCDYARRHLTMFLLPCFEKVEARLRAHSAWIRELPWYCAQHNTEHGHAVFKDVIACTEPDDDLPPANEYYTCICNNPVTPPPPGQQSDAVQCDHCYARFHGECAKNGGSCPFCDHHHWDGKIPKERSWHFCFLPTILARAPEISRCCSKEFKQLEIIVHRVDRLSAHIGHFLAFTSQPTNQRPEYIPQVRHFMRKLYKMQFAVSPNPDVSFGLDLASLHRVLAGRPLITRTRKRRRPKFKFGQDIDEDWQDRTRCICRGRTPIYRGYPDVECDICKRLYHAICVFIPTLPLAEPFTCPLCCLRKGKQYPHGEIRVIMPDRVPEPDLYVNVPEMIETCSKDILFIKLGVPHKPTIFLEIVEFTPGQPDGIITNSSTPRSFVSPSPISHPQSSPPLSSNHLSPAMRPPPANSYIPPSAHIQSAPVPPWNETWPRWGTMSTPSQPPSTQRRQPPELSRNSTSANPPPTRKRKFEDVALQPLDDITRVSSSYPPPLKRRVLPPGPHSMSPPPSRPLPPVSPSQRPTQSLSPSLRKLIAEENQEVQTSASSPRTPYIPPIRQNGNDSRSPTLPPVKSLVSGLP